MFERVKWSLLNCSKIISGLGPPISPSGHQEVPISSSLGSLICPLRHQRAPQINVPLRHQWPNFPFSSSGHLAPHSFPLALLWVSNFPIASSKGKGHLIFHCAIKRPQFPNHVIKMMTSNFSSRYQGAQFIIASSRAPYCDL